MQSTPTHVPRATVKDVAQRAGVSVGTASQTFNRPETVSEEAQRAVLRAASELDYRPNAVARSLVARRRRAMPHRDPNAPRLVAVGYVSVDFVVAIDTYPAAGARVTSQFIDKMIGGPAANVAVFAAGLGDPLTVRVELVTRLGSDADSAWMVEELARLGVDAASAETVPGERLSRCIVLVDAAGQRTIVNEPLQVPVELVTRHLAGQGRSGGQSCVHFDGFHVETAERVADQLHEQGHLLSLHAAGLSQADVTADRVSAWLSLFDLLFLDRSTIEWLTGSGRPDDIASAFNPLWLSASDPRCRAVLVTEGSDGATLLRPGLPPLKAAAPAVAVIDATGAGDAFTGVFLGSFLSQGDPAVALRHAVAGASLSVTAYGAQGRVVRAVELGLNTITPAKGAA